MAVSGMRHASGHNYTNSSFIVDVAMGQIPRSTERISSIYHFFNATRNTQRRWQCLSRSRSLYAIARPSVCRLSVTHTALFHQIGSQTQKTV